ncbi:hypothetical protein WJX72_010989 [[Myrmecia] bisecta]|uniref:OTU domain-containing protein n=1 Tax=[Myrmecia] bisecta TaxID=41462 RepID=A0AAW1RAK1_9CHLO
MVPVVIGATLQAKRKGSSSTTTSSNSSKVASSPAYSKPPPNRKARKPQAESPHWQDELATELAASGLRVKPVAADGNCFFRAVADQLEGADGDHMALRGRVVHYMRCHHDDYAPYMEDDEDFQHYCKRMAEEGTWAGQHEQVALARLLGLQLRIYQAGQPCWTLRPGDPDFPPDAPTIHLSYHGMEHYNSVRLADDFGRGPPLPLELGGGPMRPSKPARKVGEWSAKDEERVMQGTGCYDAGARQQAIRDAAGKADQAIELLIERLAAEAADEPSANGCAGGSDVQQGMSDADSTQEDSRDCQVINPGKTTGSESYSNAKVKKQDQPLEQADAGPARNKACPCGSHKKYKSCCGAAKAAAKRRAQACDDQEPNAVNGAASQLATLYI